MPNVITFAPPRYPTRGEAIGEAVAIGMQGVSEAMFTYDQLKRREENDKMLAASWVMDRYGPEAIGRQGLEELDKHFRKAHFPLPRDVDGNVLPPKPRQEQMIRGWIDEVAKNHPEKFEEIKTAAAEHALGLTPQRELQNKLAIQASKNEAEDRRTRLSGEARIIAAEIAAGARRNDTPSGYGEVNGEIYDINKARQMDPNVKELDTKTYLARTKAKIADIELKIAEAKRDHANMTVLERIKSIPAVMKGLKDIKEGHVPPQQAQYLHDWIIGLVEEERGVKYTEPEKKSLWDRIMGIASAAPTNALASPDDKAKGQEFLKQVGPQVLTLIHKGMSPDAILSAARTEGDKYGMGEEFFMEAGKALTALGPEAYAGAGMGRGAPPATGTVTAPQQ